MDRPVGLKSAERPLRDYIVPRRNECAPWEVPTPGTSGGSLRAAGEIHPVEGVLRGPAKWTPPPLRATFRSPDSLLPLGFPSLAGGIGMPKDQKIFEAKGVSKVYEMGAVQVHALREVDIDLVEGELVVILGASGSGKSTLLNILGGLDR